MVANFNEVQWLNNFLNIGSLEAEGLESVRNFVFLWNLFEDVAMNKDANMNKIRQLVDRIHQIMPMDTGELVEFVEYFSNRYLDSTGQSPYSLDGLVDFPKLILRAYLHNNNRSCSTPTLATPC